VSNQLLLNQIDEEIDFLLVVTALADARPGERDVVDISRSENHSSPGVLDVTGNVKCRALRLRIMLCCTRALFAAEQLTSGWIRTDVKHLRLRHQLRAREVLANEP